MKTAMILAAGRGERLRPLTDHTPKPMCPVQDIPLIEHHVANLAQAGFTNIVINHAHLGGQIRHHLGNGARWNVAISYSPEPPGGLETAGGIINALPLLGGMPFLTVNADIYTDFDFSQLSLSRVECMHLVLIKKNSELGHHGDFGLQGGLLTNETKNYTFAGIACYHPKIFNSCTLGRYSITPLIRALAQRQQVRASEHQGLWFDIGSLERLAAANNFVSVQPS